MSSKRKQISKEESTDSVISFWAQGADLSLLKRNMDRGYVYKMNHVAVDPVELFRESGFNYARLRLFHTPNMHGAQVNDLPYTLSLAKQLVKSDFKILLNIHYSDTWADPGKQFVPKKWENLSFDELEKAVYEYTMDVIRSFVQADVRPHMVQIGNEITPGMLWDHGKVAEAHEANTPHWTRVPSSNNRHAWNRFGQLLKAGICGVREVTGRETSIMIHIDRGGDLETSRWFFDNLAQQEVPFDVIGQSYYPFWHGMPEDLNETLNSLAKYCEKDVYVVEAAYPWKYHDMYKNSLNGDHEAWRRLKAEYPLSPEGQLRFIREVIGIVKNIVDGRGKGVFYWAPEWIRPPQPGFEDESDAESCWARALFDDDGNALPTLNAFQRKLSMPETRKKHRVIEIQSGRTQRTSRIIPE